MNIKQLAQEHGPIIMISTGAFSAMLFGTWLMASLYISMQSNLELNRQQVQALKNQDKMLNQLHQLAEDGATERTTLSTTSRQQATALNNHEKILQRIDNNDADNKQIMASQKKILESLDRAGQKTPP